jgi:hypothetical protein
MWQERLKQVERMSDLISRSALIKRLTIDGYIPKAIKEAIELQPTAYDVDKVVAELGEEKTMAYDKWDGGSSYKAYSQAIDIVRKGGVADV